HPGNHQAGDGLLCSDALRHGNSGHPIADISRVMIRNVAKRERLTASDQIVMDGVLRLLKFSPRSGIKAAVAAAPTEDLASCSETLRRSQSAGARALFEQIELVLRKRESEAELSEVKAARTPEKPYEECGLDEVDRRLGGAKRHSSTWHDPLRSGRSRFG